MSQFAGLSDISISEDIPVEGDISVPMGSQNADNDLSTLDEPVKDTIVSETFCYRVVIYWHGWAVHMFKYFVWIIVMRKTILIAPVLFVC